MVIVAQGTKKLLNTTQKLLFKGFLFLIIVLDHQFFKVANALI